nr:SMC family ATPase [Microbacterium hydrocarbonoxydans]
MRLHRLEVEGFGPFRERQVVDFDVFADDGIFLIAGRTGAGKSSILDAVCFGLYGGVPRYEGGEKRLRSDHCGPDDITEVVVDFSTPAGRYRVRRSPDYERPKKRGGGTTVQPAAVQLDVLVDDRWIGLAAKEREAAHELDGILQLSREQFLQVILLAQNRFSEFLLAGSRERQSLLRRLFGTERFEDVQARFDERRRAAEHALGARLATVTARLDEAERLVDSASLGADPSDDDTQGIGRAAAPGESADARLTALGRARARAMYRAERRDAERIEAQARSVAADERLTAIRDDQRAQVERDRARKALEALDSEEPEIARARTELDDARAAEVLRAPITAAARARSLLDAAVDAEVRARDEWRAVGPEVEDLEQWVEEETKATGAWQRAAVLERTSADRERERESAEEAVRIATERLEAGEREREALPARRDELRIDREATRRVADRAADLVAARDAAAVRLAAARDTERLRVEREAADHVLAACSAALADAQAVLAELRRRRLDGFSGELAVGLVAGRPCPVCGSSEHPAPAEHADPVSAGDVDSAESDRDRAATREREASERAAELRAEYAVAESRADGRTVEIASDELISAEEELTQSVAAEERCTQLDVLLEELALRLRRLDDERERDVATLASSRETAALITQRIADADSAIDEARGSFASVAERLAQATAQIRAASRAVEASAERVRRSDADVEARGALDAALGGSAFDDVTAVESALRSSAVQASLESRIAQHAIEREKERSILLPLELRTLPEEPIDVSPAEAASLVAREQWSQAVDEASRAAAVAEQLVGLIESAAEENERITEALSDFEILRGLADALAGRGANTHKMTLETFVLAAELEEIVDAANRRLGDMSTGRYQLRHSDALAARGAASGLGIVVFDAFTGQTRPAQSLSGGETFLSSLALALGLAEVVTARAGGIRLDTLFIDEGFGSLDGDTLDVAMRTLDELRQGGRTVGVISHVEAMQEQIPAQLRVRATSEGPSVIESR